MADLLKKRIKGRYDEISEKGKDMSGFFANIFHKYDQQNQQSMQKCMVLYDASGNPVLIQAPNIAQPQMNAQPQMGMQKSQPQTQPVARSLSQAKVVSPQQSAQELESFLESITQEEYDNLTQLQEDRILIPIKVAKSMQANGESLSTERLENLGFIKSECFDDMVQFSITQKGRQLLENIEVEE